MKRAKANANEQECEMQPLANGGTSNNHQVGFRLSEVNSNLKLIN